MFISQMSSVRILVSYDGEWVESPEAGIFKFSGSKGKGMLVPKTIKYQELLDKVCRLLMVDQNEFSLSMKVLYTSSVPVPPAEVVNDDDVSFFIGENSSNVSLRTPLCVTLVQKSLLFGEGSNGTVNIAPGTKEQVHVPVINLDRIEDNLPVLSVDNKFEDDEFGTSSAEIVADDVSVEPQLDNGHPRSSNNNTIVDPATPAGCVTPAIPAADKSHSVQHRAQQNPVEWVTTREDLAAIKKDAVTASRRQGINARTREEPLSPSSVKHSWELGTRHLFPSKKELQEKISILAIREKFEFKVKRSSKKVFHVQCVEEGCQWQLRAAIIRNSTSFQIRKFVKDHSCSKKARGKVHRQASSWIIGQHIKSKCQGSNEAYKPREIIEDIQKELGLNLSYEKAWRAREKALYSDGGTPRPHGSKAGRPKKQRIELGEEVERAQNNCGICGKLGHNRKTCSAQTELLKNGSSGCAQDTAPSTIQEVELEPS